MDRSRANDDREKQKSMTLRQEEHLELEVNGSRLSDRVAGTRNEAGAIPSRSARIVSASALKSCRPIDDRAVATFVRR
jgi:hypothetical protein